LYTSIFTIPFGAMSTIAEVHVQSETCYTSTWSTVAWYGTYIWHGMEPIFDMVWNLYL